MPPQNRSDPQQGSCRARPGAWPVAIGVAPPALACAALLVAICVALVVAIGGPPARAAAGGRPAPSESQLASSTYAAKLALLRRVASGGSGWEPLRRGTPPAAGGPAAVTVWTEGDGTRVPNDFLGLSFEATTLSSLSTLAQGGTLTNLLSSLGRGTLRFGGGSVNRYVGWQQPGARAARWDTHPVTTSVLGSLASVAHRTGWKVLLTMNLARYEPRAVAEEAAAARRELGRSLAGIAVGNEPDRFGTYGLRSSGWDFSQYAQQLATYRGAIASSAPHTQLAAPDVSTGEPPLPWVWESIRLHPAILTDHYYPLTACGHKPTATQLLSPEVRLEETVMLSTLAAIQRTAGAPLEIDETNDISCKGQPGVSNTFASALWASDYIARAMRAGLRGIDFHTLLNLPQSYTALVGEGPSLHPNPEWYALLLTHALQGSSVLPTAVGSDSNITAQGFVRPDGTVQVLLVNFYPEGSRTRRVNLTVHGRSSDATVLRLTAPSTLATSGVTLGGAEVAASGHWHPRGPLPVVHERTGTLTVSMPAASAALVTIPPQ